MYTVAVRRDFRAYHYLVGGDWGKENKKHAHHYYLEVRLQGPELDRHGYLVDIVDIEKNVEKLIAHFKDHTLNELPEFSGINPSLEHFSRICCAYLSTHIHSAQVKTIAVTIWEDKTAWARFCQEL